MKLKILPGIFFLLAFSSVAAAQPVVITSKKITYKRPKPVADFKKTFTVNYPVVKAATPALSRKIETTISYAKVHDLNIKDEINEVQWLEEADFAINYNQNGILDITLSLRGSGAYPSTSFKTVVVDLKTGNRVLAADVFTDLKGLAARIKKAQQAEMEKTREEYSKNTDSHDFDASEYFSRADFTVENLSEFTVSDKGVTFIYDYGFPHVVKALQPDGRYSFDWAELKPFIKPGGLLARFVR